MCNADHVKLLYYAGLPEINPSRIVPKGPSPLPDAATGFCKRTCTID